MKINIILVNECGEELIAETLDANTIALLGDQVDDFIEFKLVKLWERYPEARYIYREDEKSIGEMRADRYTETYEYWLKYAEENPEEVGDWDPEEWADEQARDEMDNEWGLW